LGKESVFIAQQRRTSRCWKKIGNILTCSAGTVRYGTVVAVPNSKYTYHVGLLPYLNQLVPDLTYIHIYIYIYIRTYIHTYINTYIHTFIHTCTHTYCIYIHTIHNVHTYIHKYVYTYIHTYIHTHLLYRVSQEERTKLREGVPYVKLYRYNPKRLYPKLNGYGDNGQRKVWTSCISA